MWKKGDVILVILPGIKILGRSWQTNKNNDAFIEKPCEVVIIQTPNGPKPVLYKLDVFLEEEIQKLEISAEKYITAGKARRELSILYSQLEEKQEEAPISPKKETKIEKCGKIIKFRQ